MRFAMDRRFRSRRLSVSLMLLLSLAPAGLAGCSNGALLSRSAAPEEGIGADPDAVADPSTADDVTYTVSIEGVADDDLVDLLEQTSRLIALQGRPAASRAALDRRIGEDRDRLNAALRSEGYYGAAIDHRLDEGSPLRVTIAIDPGPPYLLSSFDLTLVGDGDTLPPDLPEAADLNVGLGERARAKRVVDGERQVLRRLGGRGRPLARIEDRRIIVDHTLRTMAVALDVDPGPPARFGPVIFDGLDRVDEGYLRRLIPWSRSDAFDGEQVDAFRRTLGETGLFGSIQVQVGDAVDDQGEVPITVAVSEIERRSIGATARYYSSEGPAGEVFWEHRNLFGDNEDLRLTAGGSRLRQKAEASLLVPDIREPGQDGVLNIEGRRTDTDAFRELGAEAQLQLRQPLSPSWRLATGPLASGGRLEDEEGTRTTTLVGFLGAVTRDDTDNRLDPTRGSRLRLAATPAIGWVDKTLHLLFSEVSGSAYGAVDGGRRVVLAARAKAGSIIGEGRTDVPANRRFYAGGGDSVRGYAFQKVGPLDPSNDPIGGRSLIEVGAEVRARVWGNFGVVPFIDGGNVFEEVYPDFSEDLRWGAGLGLRYGTLAGPIRADVAFPLNPRNDLDDPFQIYLSLGQAF
jgi:translocation and assembly module TamA